MNIDIWVKIFKALGEPTRLRILKVLSVRPMYVCELGEVLQISQPRISQHLRVMKEAGLLIEKKDAQRTFYTLRVTFLEEHFGGMIAYFNERLENLPEFKDEYSRLQQLDTNCNVALCKQGKTSSVKLKQET